MTYVYLCIDTVDSPGKVLAVFDNQASATRFFEWESDIICKIVRHEVLSEYTSSAARD